METLLALIILFVIGTTAVSFIAAMYRSFITMFGNNSSSSQSRQREMQQRTDLRNKESVSLKDAFIANNATRQGFASKSSTAAAQKRNKQAQSKQLTTRLQQDAAKRRAENLQQNNKRRPKTIQSSAAPKSPLLHENDARQITNQTLFDTGDLTSLTPIDKVTSTKKTNHRSVAKKTHFQNDYVKGIIYKEILDKPVSLRRNK